jgi:hypothetical protein
LGEASDALGYEFRGFHVIGGGGKDAGDEDLIGGKLVGLPDFPFMLVAGVGAFDEHAHRLRFEGNGEDGREREVVDMGTFIVAPADVETNAIGGNVGEGVIERFEV